MIIRFISIIFLLLVIYIANAFTNPIPSVEVGRDSRPLYGFSYSFEHSEWYGLNSRSSYLKLLDEVKPDWVRLSFFWDRHTKGDELNLEELEFAISEAEKRDIKVIVAIGLKTPYYPEYHLPVSIRDQIKFRERIDVNHPIADDVLAIDRKVISKLANFGNIIYWQVENEPLIGNINKWKIDPSLIAAEADLVREIDLKKRPIILNHAAVGFYDRSWKDLLPILRIGDVFAVNAFFKTQGVDLVTAKIFGREVHVLWPEWLVWPVHSWLFLSPNFKSIKETAQKNGNDLWILEMQAEPYIRGIDFARGNKFSFAPDDILNADKFLRSKGITSIGLWGASFWQFRESMGDRSWIETARQLMAR